MKANLLNDAGYIATKTIAFPAEVEVEKANSPCPHIYTISHEELMRVGANPDKLAECYYCFDSREHLQLI